VLQIKKRLLELGFVMAEQSKINLELRALVIIILKKFKYNMQAESRSSLR